MSRARTWERTYTEPADENGLTLSIIWDNIEKSDIALLLGQQDYQNIDTIYRQCTRVDIKMQSV